jgi:hypothetical protein
MKAIAPMCRAGFPESLREPSDLMLGEVESLNLAHNDEVHRSSTCQLSGVDHSLATP